MEREAERIRERQADAWHDPLKEQIRQRLGLKKRLSGPRVVRFEKTPWETTPTGRQHKRFVWPPWDEREYQWPIRTMFAGEQVIPPGETLGLRHRHYNEAIFYVIEGRGHEVHDGTRYDWEAGDLYSIPVYADHQHFNDSLTEPARLFFSANLYSYLYAGISYVDNLKMPKTPPDAEPILGDDKEVLGFRYTDGQEIRFGLDPFWDSRMSYITSNPLCRMAPKTTYDRYVTRLKDEFELTLKEPHVVKQSEVPWEETRMGRIKFLVHPGRTLGLLQYDAFIQEMPPGSRSGQHRHLSEEIHLILQGKGYDIHDGVRWDWEKEDVVCIPPGTTHQHFNADRMNPARFLALQSKLAMALGHGGIEHFEDAS